MDGWCSTRALGDLGYALIAITKRVFGALGGVGKWCFRTIAEKKIQNQPGNKLLTDGNGPRMTTPVEASGSLTV